MFFEKIDHFSYLAIFFNEIFRQLRLVRKISSPTTFKDIKNLKDESDGLKDKFFHTCLFELYAHAVIRKLEDWYRIISEYLKEYNGSWEYYARSKRLYLINEFGGGTQDYNEDGTVKTDVDIDTIISNSIINYLVPEDWRDIVIETEPDDLNYIYTCISVNGSFTLQDMFKAIGASLKSYRVENGNMVENNEDDELLHKITCQDQSERYVSLLYTIVSIISRIVIEIKTLPKDKDNKEYFENLQMRITNIFNFDIADEIENLKQGLESQS